MPSRDFSLSGGSLCNRCRYPALQGASGTVLIGDKGYDSDEYRAALKAKGLIACTTPDYFLPDSTKPPAKAGVHGATSRFDAGVSP